jgi:hypothetical protein
MIELTIVRFDNSTRHGRRAMREMLCGVDRHPASGSVPWSKANREAGNGQSISPDGTGGFMTEQNTSFIDFLETHPARLASDSTKKWLAEFYLAGYAAGERAARQEWRPIETAPKDCLLIVSDCCSIALAHIVAGDVWTQYVHGTPMLFQPDLKFKPSHWMPLPEATIKEPTT